MISIKLWFIVDVMGFCAVGVAVLQRHNVFIIEFNQSDGETQELCMRVYVRAVSV